MTGHTLPLGMEAAAWRPEPQAVAHRGTRARLTRLLPGCAHAVRSGRVRLPVEMGPLPSDAILLPDGPTGEPISWLWVGCWATSPGVGRGTHRCMAAAPLGAGAGLLLLKQNCV